MRFRSSSLTSRHSVAVRAAVAVGVAGALITAGTLRLIDQPSAGPRSPDPDRETHLAAQPLAGLGGGITIRELSQKTPFSLVALTGDLADTSTRIRARHADGSWGPWYQTEYATLSRDATSPLGPGPNTPQHPRSTEPVFVGSTTQVQLAITRPPNAAVTGPAPTQASTTGPDLGYRPVSRQEPLADDISAILISPPRSPARSHWTPPPGVTLPGQAPPIISRAEWGADESLRCESPQFGKGVQAAVVHHTAGSNDYAPEDSAGIVKAIYTYQSKTLGWCDIAYNALVDKYGQIFEGGAGGITKPVEGFHTGGFNHNTWGVAMIGNFDDVAPTPEQVQAVGHLIGWRLGLDNVDPLSTVSLESAGSHYTYFPTGTVATLPAIFAHRDVGNTDCPGNAAYALMGQIRDIASHADDPPPELLQALQGGAIYDRWVSLGATHGVLGSPTSPELEGLGEARYVTFRHGAVYWSPVIGAQPVVGAIYDAWASLDYERGPLGLPTGAELQEPLQISQNFQHGTLNFERLTGAVTGVIDGIPVPVTSPPADVPSGPPERSTLADRPPS